MLLADNQGHLKLAPQAKTKIDPIEADKRFGAEASILQTLEHGRAAIDAEISALRIEDYLGRPSTMRPGPQGRTPGNKLRLSSRTATLQARLEKHRAAAPAKSEDVASSGSATVVAALEIIRGARPPSRANRAELIKQAEADRDVIREAILAQAAIVEELRGELSAALAKRLGAQYRELTLGIFRAAQAFAAASDAEQEFRRSVTEAGFTWREDLLRGPQLRAALVLGSETTWDSDISRARRMLEELKIL